MNISVVEYQSVTGASKTSAQRVSQSQYRVQTRGRRRGAGSRPLLSRLADVSQYRTRIAAMVRFPLVNTRELSPFPMTTKPSHFMFELTVAACTFVYFKLQNDFAVQYYMLTYAPNAYR